MKENTQSSYRQIFKATSVFGGVQVFNILVTIIKTKVVALLLGPEGVGIIGLFKSTVDIVSNLSNLGLAQSAVRDVARANGLNDKTELGIIVVVVRKWIWITGTAGTVILLFFAPLFSEFSFGNRNYTFAFMLLSLTILLTAITSGKNILMQGTRNIKYMAASGLLGAIVGLLVSVPLFYIWGMKGIVPSLVLTAIVTLIISFYYSNKIKIENVYLTIREIVVRGESMLKLGISMMISAYLVTLTSYLIRAYISRVGGIDEVGFFQAGFSLVEVYFGMVFTAMSADYYPRLTGSSENSMKMVSEINHQIEIALLILLPLILVFILFIPYIVTLLYSSQFIPTIPYISYAVFGIIFKSVSWACGFVLFAMGKNKLFLFTAFFFNIIFLFNNVLGYKLNGLMGLGISYAVNYLIHFIFLVYIIKRIIPYKLTYNVVCLLICVILFSICGSVVYNFVSNNELRMILSCILVAMSSVYVFIELDKRIKFLKRRNYDKKNL